MSIGEGDLASRYSSSVEEAPSIVACLLTPRPASSTHSLSRSLTRSDDHVEVRLTLSLTPHGSTCLVDRFPRAVPYRHESARGLWWQASKRTTANQPYPETTESPHSAKLEPNRTKPNRTKANAITTTPPSEHRNDRLSLYTHNASARKTKHKTPGDTAPHLTHTHGRTRKLYLSLSQPAPLLLVQHARMIRGRLTNRPPIY